MRVSLAAQILSHLVAAGMNTLVATNQLNAVTAKNSANFVEKMDVLFDLMNSRESALRIKQLGAPYLIGMTTSIVYRK
jgi:hypothetical protein